MYAGISPSRYSSGLPCYNTSGFIVIFISTATRYFNKYLVYNINCYRVSCYSEMFSLQKWYIDKRIWRTRRKLTRKRLRVWKSRTEPLTSGAHLLIENVIISLGCACRPCRGGASHKKDNRTGRKYRD